MKTVDGDGHWLEWQCGDDGRSLWMMVVVEVILVGAHLLCDVSASVMA